MEIKNLKRELKQSISPEDYRVLKQALTHMCQDKINPCAMHTARVHCLYFEASGQPDGKQIEKFNFHYVNEDKDFIRLEKKSKKKELFLERSACINRRDCERILAGDTESLGGADDPLLFEFLSALACNKLKPKLLVDCTRETFVLNQGAVLVKIDSDFSSGANVSDF